MFRIIFLNRIPSCPWLFFLSTRFVMLFPPEAGGSRVVMYLSFWPIPVPCQLPSM